MTFDALTDAVEWWDMIPGRWRDESILKLHDDHFPIQSRSITSLFKGTPMSIMVWQLYFWCTCQCSAIVRHDSGKMEGVNSEVACCLFSYLAPVDKGRFVSALWQAHDMTQIFVFDIYQSRAAAACLKIQISMVGFQFIPVSASRGQNSSSWNLRNTLHHINLPWWLNGWEWGRW